MDSLTTILTGLISNGPVIITVLSVIFVFCVVMFVLSWKSGKSFSLSLGPFKLVLGGKKKEESPILKSEQEMLINSVKTLVFEKCERIHEIRGDAVERQMKFADEKIVEIKSIVTNRYAKQLQEKIPAAENAKTHKDYRAYQIMIGLLSNDLRDKVLRVSLVENHILDYSDIEWEDYLNQKSELMITMACDFIDVMYDGGSKVVTLKDLSEGNQDIIHTVKEMIKMIFRKARHISLENKKKIDEIENEIETDLNKLKGVSVENKKTSMD